MCSAALPLFKEHRILHLVAEFVPGRTEKISAFSDVRDTFTKLYEYGYMCTRAFDLNGDKPGEFMVVQRLDWVVDFLVLW